MPIENRSKTETAMATDYSKLGSWRHIDAGRKRRRLGLHRASHDRKCHRSPGQHDSADRDQQQGPTLALGLARLGDDRREAGDDLLRRGQFLRDALLRIPEFLGQPTLFEATS